MFGATALVSSFAPAMAQTPRANDTPSPQPREELSEARHHFRRGQRAYADGRLSVALEHLKKAYALAPSAELAYNLGRVLERMARPAESARYYRRYLRAATVSEAERSEIERRLEALDALAERQSTQSLKPRPTQGELAAEAARFFSRGVTLYERGRYAQALIAFGAAQRFAEFAELSYNMALTAERLGRRREAIDHYRAYLRGAGHPADEARVRRRIATLRARAHPWSASKEKKP